MLLFSNFLFFFEMLLHLSKETDNRQCFELYMSWIVKNGDYKPVSQSYAIPKSVQFWQATGKSNLADRMEDCSTGQSVVV